MYDHSKQYKHSIIRARAISEVDDLLPKYAMVIDQICPCSKSEFESYFNAQFMDYAIKKARNPNNQEAIKKTLDNHRTEISGSLFGMYYEVDGTIYSSERTKKFLQDNDQPAFFKDWLIKMQFPNAAQSSRTYRRHIEHGINCHPYSLLLKVLEYAKRENVTLLKQEIGYYILNSEDVLMGNATPNEVFDAIMEDKRNGAESRKIIIPEGESDSYDQHIGDQLQYLQLANLIIIDGQVITINQQENISVQAFIDLLNKPLGFDIYSYDISTVSGRKKVEQDWSVYYGKLSDENDLLTTSIQALVTHSNEEILKTSTPEKKTDIGNDGELYVLEMEKKRVSDFDERLLRKVIYLGKTKGLGYDIQSVIAESGDKAEFVKYIEVKSTKRVTAPDINEEEFLDTLNITRNEWVAAEQHGKYYSIYRVYFIRGGVVTYVLSNVWEKYKDKKLRVVPLTYRLDFTNYAVDQIIDDTNEELIIINV